MQRKCFALKLLLQLGFVLQSRHADLCPPFSDPCCMGVRSAVQPLPLAAIPPPRSSFRWECFDGMLLAPPGSSWHLLAAWATATHFCVFAHLVDIVTLCAIACHTSTLFGRIAVVKQKGLRFPGIFDSSTDALLISLQLAPRRGRPPCLPTRETAMGGRGGPPLQFAEPLLILPLAGGTTSPIFGLRPDVKRGNAIPAASSVRGSEVRADARYNSHCRGLCSRGGRLWARTRGRSCRGCG